MPERKISYIDFIFNFNTFGVNKTAQAVGVNIIMFPYTKFWNFVRIVETLLML